VYIYTVGRNTGIYFGFGTDKTSVNNITLTLVRAINTSNRNTKNVYE
jgi:hypothetical protein